ncbi:hypothetical protein [Paraburkholderia sp. HP33-1]|uniref:hypothetical protein n=1 Tax=Paraburkholderia sp. HP33-1 TaxID=2883243 RepID=UPI001F4395C7|nr:hypothetical protein [Paraburkholderia sp. HP33-1]
MLKIALGRGRNAWLHPSDGGEKTPPARAPDRSPAGFAQTNIFMFERTYSFNTHPASHPITCADHAENYKFIPINQGMFGINYGFPEYLGGFRVVG